MSWSWSASVLLTPVVLLCYQAFKLEHIFWMVWVLILPCKLIFYLLPTHPHTHSFYVSDSVMYCDDLIKVLRCVSCSYGDVFLGIIWWCSVGISICPYYCYSKLVSWFNSEPAFFLINLNMHWMIDTQISCYTYKMHVY
jgi:hypothetical protein